MIGWVRENWLYGVLGIVASMIVAPGAVAQVPVLGGLVAGDTVECVTDAATDGGTDETACVDPAEAEAAPESLAMRDEVENVAGEAEEAADEAAPKPRRARDRDGDGVRNRKDNCPDVANPGQRDRDGDGVGDRCAPAPAERDTPVAQPAEPEPEPTPEVAPTPDPVPEIEPDPQDPDAGDGQPPIVEPEPIVDRDGDRIADDIDNCPDVKNRAQMDRDGDGVGDMCDIPDECANVGDDPTFVYPRPAPSGRLLTMVGTPGNDVFFGQRSGARVMYGMGGNDCFIGEHSSTVVFGGAGDDVMIVHRARNVLFSAGGRDTVVLREVPFRHRRVICFGFPPETTGCTTVAEAPEPGSIFDVEGLRIRRDGQVAERLWRLAVNAPPGMEWPGFGDEPVVIRG